MDKEAELSKLNALVGAALKGLVEAGASAEAIGAFAASYRQDASRILGLVESPPEAPDLRELVTEAVSQALSDAGVGSQTAKMRKQPAMKFYVTVEGKRTSVTISPEKADQLIKSKGGRDQANAFVEQLANNAPANVKNRSKWIEERLLASMNFAQTEASHARH